MTLTDKIAAIRAGLDGVTPGPWRVGDDTVIWAAGRGVHSYPVVSCDIKPCAHWAEGPDIDEGCANAAHTARLDPQTVGELLDEIDRLRAENVRQIAALQIIKRLRCPQMQGIPAHDVELRECVNSLITAVRLAKEALRSADVAVSACNEEPSP